MSQVPYKTANRVFWVIDNGSSHRGRPFIERLQRKWPNAIAVHLLIHASWLNQIEIYFAIVQKKALTPNDFLNLQAVRERLLDFQTRYQEIARPFSWKFTRKDLKEKFKIVSDHIIEQHQPVTSQDFIAEELRSRDEVQETPSAYAYT